jgi:16S rRNA G966 N2-methylase RsmD
LATQLRQTVQRLNTSTVRVLRGDGVAALRAAAPGSADLVLLDPPFDAPALFTPALVAAATAVRVGGWVYLEAPAQAEAGALQALGLEAHRHLKAGAVHAHLLHRA